MSEIRLKSINALLMAEDHKTSASYFIPAYQRGYRWGDLQVTQLLDDVWEFIQTSEGKDRNQFYCLQPLVVRKKDSTTFEVVDGQQRLTTLYILLTVLKKQLDALEKQRFTLHYETRGEANAAFLEEIDLAREEENIDFYFMCQAYKAIERWFTGRDGTHKMKLLQHFLHDDEAGRNVRVIWFELAETDKSVDAFTRLNVGKIPLTNGELIRALFLKRSNAYPEDSAQLRIAYEWDLIEKALQGAAFWSFLSNNVTQGGARIGFLFDLVAQREGMKQTVDDYATFNHFSQKLAAKNADREKEWLAVKQTFMLFEEWFQDRRLYHLIGFLIWNGMGLNEIRTMADGSPKEEFREKLRTTICERAIGKNPPTEKEKFREWIANSLDGLHYPGDSRRIRSSLLLFNLATLLENPKSNMLFQFESFKTAMWDIEHVRSVAPDRPGTYKGQIEWLNHCLGYLRWASEGPELQKEIEAFLNLQPKEATDAAFETLYEMILAHFHEAGGDEVNNGIDNLVLLDYATNRSYKNSVFAVKRYRILSLDRHGIFVPLCTRNVFLKSYNPRVEHMMFWTEDDSDGYRQVMIDTLHKFFIGGPPHD